MPVALSAAGSPTLIGRRACRTDAAMALNGEITKFEPCGPTKLPLAPMDERLVGTKLRYPYEVRSQEEYFDDIQDLITKDILDLPSTS